MAEIIFNLDNGEPYLKSDLNEEVIFRYGYDWTTHDNTDDQAISNTGQYMAVIDKGISDDYGVTWYNTGDTLGNDDDEIEMSYDGKYMTIIDYEIAGINMKRSSDYGVSFDYITGYTFRYLTDVSVSATGQYQIIAGDADPEVYISSDYGVSWITKNVGGVNDDPHRCAVSGNGQYMVIGSEKQQIQVSNDSGTTWVATGLTNADYIRDIRINYSGQYMLLVSSEKVWVSSTYGTTWTEKTSSMPSTLFDYQHCGLMGDGQYMLVGTPDFTTSDGTFVYFSDDYGDTWVKLRPPFGGFRNIISGDGNYVMTSNPNPSGGGLCIGKRIT